MNIKFNKYYENVAEFNSYTTVFFLIMHAQLIYDHIITKCVPNYNRQIEWHLDQSPNKLLPHAVSQNALLPHDSFAKKLALRFC